jgi:hypothetical protein
MFSWRKKKQVVPRIVACDIIAECGHACDYLQSLQDNFLEIYIWTCLLCLSWAGHSGCSSSQATTGQGRMGWGRTKEKSSRVRE